MNNSQPRIASLELGKNVRGVITAAVVHYDDLVIIGKPAKSHVREDHHACDGAGVVVSGEKGADARTSHAQRTLPSALARSPGPTRATRVRKTSSTVIVIRQS